MNRIRTLAQVVGFVTMGLLALYGLLVLSGVAGPLGLTAEADAELPNTANEAAAVLGGTIPQTMNYQGFLRNPDGSLTTGSYTITAHIYELAAPSVDETPCYTTTIPNVTVRDGLFNIVLGDDPPLPPTAFSDAPRYIGIDLNDGGGELIPRQRLHAVPWALTATTLVDDAPAQSVQGLSSSGDITVTSGDLTVDGTLYVGGVVTGTSSGVEFEEDGKIDFTTTDACITSDDACITVKDLPLILIRRMEDLPVGEGWNEEHPIILWNDIKVKREWYDCVATGWEAIYEINANGSYPNVVWTWAKEDPEDGEEYWFVDVDMSSTNDHHDTADVDVVCFKREIVHYVGERELHAP